MEIIKINNFDDIKLFSSALWLYEFKFQMVSGYSTLVHFQSGTRNFVLYIIFVFHLLLYRCTSYKFNKNRKGMNILAILYYFTVHTYLFNSFIPSVSIWHTHGKTVKFAVVIRIVVVMSPIVKNYKR